MTYRSEIISSARPLSTIEKFNLRDTSGAVGINDAVQKNGGELQIDGICNLVVTSVHNDKVKEGNSTDYENYFLLDVDGIGYYTSSETLFSDLEAIFKLIEESELKVACVSIIVKEFPSKSQRQGFMKATLKSIVYEDGTVEE